MTRAEVQAWIMWFWVVSLFGMSSLTGSILTGDWSFSASPTAGILIVLFGGFVIWLIRCAYLAGRRSVK